MRINNIKGVKSLLGDFNRHDCVVIICRYNGGKSSFATELIHKHFGEDKTYYVTFIDQNKPNFLSRKSKLKFNEIVNGKIIVFDELSDEQNRDIRGYVKKLIKNNLCIILSNPYASSNDAEKEIALFKEAEKEILPLNTMFIFVDD